MSLLGHEQFEFVQYLYLRKRVLTDTELSLFRGTRFSTKILTKYSALFSVEEFHKKLVFKLKLLIN